MRHSREPKHAHLLKDKSVMTKTLYSMKRNWYKFRVKYPKTMDDGKKKKVSEEYLVDAESFTETEKAMPIRLQQILSAHETLTSLQFPVNLCPTSSRAQSKRAIIGTRLSWPLSPRMTRRDRRNSRHRSCMSMPKTPRKLTNYSVSTWMAVWWIGKSSPSQRPRCSVCLNTNNSGKTNHPKTHTL